MPTTEAELAATSFTSDFFYVIAIRNDGTIDWLLREQVNNLTWREATVDLAQYKGQTIRLQFGTYNNGLYGISRTFVDAASLVVCPGGTATSTPTSTATPTPTRTPTATPTQPPTATPVPGTCTDVMLNGGFESNTGWIFRNNPVLAGYATNPVLAGQRSLRTGISVGVANVESYSPAEQALTVPSWAASAQLRFSRYNVLGETAAVGAVSIEEMAMPTTEAELAATSFISDFFYVIAIRNDGTIDWLLREQVNNLTWREATVDLAQYKGQTIRLQFGTYNNGLYGISRTFVDAASLVVCR